MYTTYLSMKTVPPGVILERLIREKHLKKKQVASDSLLIPQRLNDLMKGNRRFTPQVSFNLEKTLGIDIPGFFYLIQSNHDIYVAGKEQQAKFTPDLDKLTKTTFWDVDIKKIDWEKAWKWAIRRVLEYGTKTELLEMDVFYGHEKILAVFNDSDSFRLQDNARKNFYNAFPE